MWSFRGESYGEYGLKERLVFFNRPFLQHHIIRQLQLPAVPPLLQCDLLNAAYMAYIHAVGQAQERGKFQCRQAIFLGQGFKTILVNRRGFAAMVAHEAGDNILLTFTQANEMIGFE